MAHGLNNSGQDADEGFLNALIKMLESDRDKPVFDELDLMFKGDPIMRPFPIVPDPNQLSIPSEPVVRGDFKDRINKGRFGTAFSFAKLSSETATLDIGADIVLRNLLNQLDSLPSIRSKDDKFTFPGLDIMKFFESEADPTELDLTIGRSNIPKEDI